MGTNITGIGNANAIGFKSRVTGGIYFPPELKDALVGVWSAYGKSNDSTDRNIIKNKIKNRGGDFVISNAAFKLNSGFGKYEEDFTSWRIYPNIKVTDNVITTNGNFNSTWFIYKHSSESKINEMNIKVSGIPKGRKILYLYISDETANSPIAYTIPKDGIYHLPESKINNNRVSVGFTVESRYDWNNIRIEQIPSFQGAFVTDGIDDLITSTKTVQEMLGGSNEITVVSMIHQIELNKVGASFTNYCRKVGVGYVRNEARDYGTTGIYGWSISNVNNSNSVNRNLINNILGDKELHSIDSVGDITNSIFSVNGYENASNSPSETSQLAWYWTIIANKVLTTDQINQVIAYFNLDKYVKPDIYYNVKKQGLTNDTPDEDWYLKDFSGNGRDMTLYNYARTPESGINEEGGLQSDGVVDYGQFVGDLGLKDYTVVIDRAYNNLINNQVPLISSNIVEDQTPFIVEHWNTGSNAISFSYGASRTTDIPLDINKKIVYQSTYSYMGYVIPKGNAISTGNGITLGKFGNGVQYSAICLWSLMLFPYSMSEFLIERQLKKHKLGTLYPNMVEFRPVIKANANYKITYYQIDSTNTWKSIKVGDYIVIGAKLAFQITFDNDASELKEVVSPQLSGIIVEKRPSNPGYNIYSYITSKSPQKINITIDEYIRYENIVQPYPVLLRFKDENGNEVSWGGKFKVGSTITRIGSAADSNLLPNIYNIFGLLLNDNQVTSSKVIVEKTMVFKAKSTYIFDNNEPKCILSPSKLRIPNSSYKILGYIPDISGHGNHGKINNSAYAGASGANGYLQNFSGWTKASGVSSTDSVISSSNNLVAANGWIAYVTSGTVVPTFKVEISGIPINGNLRFEGSGQTLVNGVNTIQGLTTTKISGFYISNGYDNDWSNLRIEQIGEYEGAYCLDGVDDFVTIPTLSGGKQVLMKVNWNSYIGQGILYDQRGYLNEFAIYNQDVDSSNNHVFAYQAGNNGQTYIDGILNNNINASELRNITHNITITNELSAGVNTSSPLIGSNRVHDNFFTNMALYDFMLFDEISTDDKIKELNEYVGIEAKVELPPYYWDAYGKTNFDVDKATIQQRGVAVGDYDLTNYNHAYEGMSGYNGYPVVFGAGKTLEVVASVYSYTSDVTSTTIHVTMVKNAGTGLLFSYVKKDGALTNIKEIPAFRVTVKGLEGNSKFGYRYLATEDATEETLVYLGNGTHELAKSFAPTEALLDLTRNAWVGIFITPMVEGEVVFDCDITIEVLPEYENGLVYDGITDYSKNANIPALDDFTAIIKREWLKKQGCPLIKGSKVYEGGNGNALLLEWDKAYNFVFYKRTDIMEGELPDNISFITPTNYNGNVITRGSEQDTNGICIAGDGNAGFANMVFYKLILYPKTIPLLQINFLKNLMEKDEIIDLNNPIFIQE